mmetsp:Transcript_19759/g.55139  ORF Transcript_19759/g.55139 Transcript_19759/m.55139 type:complete len:353 (+) Transcript_19759:22-1080(+)
MTMAVRTSLHLSAFATSLPCVVPRPSISATGSVSHDGTSKQCTMRLISSCCSKTDSGEPSHSPPPAQQGPTDVSLGKAAARKARRQPPSIITPYISAGFSELQGLLNNGALLIDKPLEWTSFDVCGKLRGTLKPWKVKKVGHAGTLDPMATGLLVVCTGAGTKFVDDYQAMEKEYSGVLRLGEGTPSYDGEMEVDEQLPWEHITDEDLERVARQFEGDIMQVPPMYSAIKVKGQKLYNLARDGQTVAREERPVTIMSLKLWRSDGGNMATGSSISAQTLPPAMPHKDSLACGTRTAPMGAPSTSDARQGQDSSSGAQGSIEGQPASSLHSSGRSADRTISSSSSSSRVGREN